jgi:sulfur carrier protein ThiS
MTALIRVTKALTGLLDGKEEFAVDAGHTVHETLIGLNIKPELIALVIVDGKLETKDYMIKENDVIKVMAVIGGG